MAIETVTLGGFDEHDPHAPQSLRLPTLDYVGGVARTKDALDKAISVRKGIAVLGEKGSGKSFAARRAIRAFNRLETRKLERDFKYKMRRVVSVRTIRAKHYREALIVLGQAVTGARPPERLYGRRQTDDELCNEVIANCLNQRIVAIVIREAEFLSKAAYAALRDLMAGTEDEAHEDASHAGDGPDDDPERGEAVVGVGILLIGAPQVGRILSKNAENGRRWLTPTTIPLVPANEVRRVYTDWFPGLKQHADDIGDAAWTTLVHDDITRGNAMTVGMLTTHARMYFRRMVRQQPTAKYRRETLPFNREHFRLAFREGKGDGLQAGGAPDAA